MKRIILIINALGWIVITSNSFAVDLLQTYQDALNHDPTYLSATQAVIAGREYAVQAASLYKPKLTFSSQVNRIDNRIDSNNLPPALSPILNIDSNGTVTENKITLAQPIYRAEALSGATQLREQSNMAQTKYHNSQQDLIIRCAETYFAVLFAEESLRLIQVQKAAIQRQMQSAQARFDSGRAKITDVRDAQARYDAMLASELSAQSDLAVRRAQYEELTGTQITELANVQQSFVPTQPVPTNLSYWQDRALHGNLALLIAQQNYAIAEAEIDKYRFFGRPTLDLVGSYSDTRSYGDISPLVSPEKSTTGVIGLQVSVPIDSDGKLNSQLRETQAKRQQALQDIAAAQRDARLQVQQAYLAVTTGAAQIHALQQSLASISLSFDATSLGREVGIRTELDVLNTQQQVYATQRDLSQAKYNYLLGRLRLVASIGELTIQDLMNVNDELTH